MRVMEVACEAEEGDYGSEFVEDKERGYVCDGRVAEGVCVFVQELGEAPVETVNSRLGCWRWDGRGRVGGVAAESWVARAVRLVTCSRSKEASS